MKSNYSDLDSSERTQLARSHQAKLLRGLPRGTQYEHITTKDELIDSYLHRMDDLGYPLRVEPKRDRYVLNKKGLEKAIDKVVSETFKEMDKEVNEWIKTGVIPLMEDSLQDVLDSINVVNSTYVVERTTSQKHPQKSRFEKFAENLTKALVKTIGDIVEDTAFGKDNSNKI